MRSTRSTLALFCVASLAACADDVHTPEMTPPAALSASLVGPNDEALLDGSALELVRGFQGGWHFESNLIVTGETQTERLVGMYRAHVVLDDESIASTTQEMFSEAWTPSDATSHFTYLGVMFTTAVLYPGAWIGEEATLVYTLTLDDGRMIHDTVDVTIVDEVNEAANP